MALRDCTLSTAMGACPRAAAGAHRPWRRSTEPIIFVMAAAIALMYGESWMIERVPASTVACNSALATGLNRALDAGLVALSPVQQASSL